MKIKELIEATNAKVIKPLDENLDVKISTDTRTIKDGDFYLPLKGASFDGEKFIDQALEKGAVGAFCTKDGGNLQVTDTLTAYLELANYRRKKLNFKVVAITGSSGKTTTKELVASTLSAKFKTFKTPLNHNNEIGFCQTIFETPDDTEVLVLEMGMRGLGEIELLSKYSEANSENDVWEYDESEDVWYKPIGSAPSTHIVKQSHVRLSGIVTNEQLSLVTAEKLGIDIPESFIINVGHGGDEDVLFATKRYDRILKNNHFGQGISRPLRLHQEDFAQALGIAAADKYEKSGQNYLSKIFNLIRNNASNPINDQLKMWDIIVYDFFVGNTDNHIKNISLLYSPDLRSISLAPAYDIVSTAIYEGSSREMAIGIGGERVIDNIGEKHFIDAASEIGLSKKIAMGRFDKIANEFESAINEACKRMENEGYQDVRKIKEMILRKGGFGHM